MFGEILNLLNHYSCDKIHSWHAVNQEFSQGYVSGSPLKNYGVEGWGGSIPLEDLGVKLEAFLVHFPQLSADKVYVLTDLTYNGSCTLPKT